MKSSKLTRLFAAAALAVTAMTGTAAHAAPPAPTPEQQAEIERLTNLYRELLERVAAESAAKPDIEKIGMQAIQNMIAGIDPHSSFELPQDADDLRAEMNGTYGGIGVDLEMRGGKLFIVAALPDTPAADADIRADDVIVAVDGKDIAGMTLDDASALIGGEPDDPVTLTITRAGAPQPIEVTVVRDIIEDNPVRSALLPGAIGYVRLEIFSEPAARSVREAVRALQKQAHGQLKGLVLDLRDNPGGLLDQGISLADLFLDDGLIVTSRGVQKDDNRSWTARRGDMLHGAPMVVLINQDTASAAELVAGALQDNKRATVLGVRSYGKGSVQSLIPVSVNGRFEGELRLTTALYFTPSGDSIQGRGITPQILFDDPNAPAADTAEPQGEAANDGMIANPETAQDDTASEAVCRPAPAADTARADRALLRARDENGMPAVDFALACAVGKLRGSSALTVTAPLPASPGKSVPIPLPVPR